MTTGDKIKKIRTFRDMTQKVFGVTINFGKNGMYNRITQYKTNFRVPKTELYELQACGDVTQICGHQRYSHENAFKD